MYTTSILSNCPGFVICGEARPTESLLYGSYLLDNDDKPRTNCYVVMDIRVGVIKAKKYDAFFS